MLGKLTMLDVVIVGIYFGVVFWIGWWASRTSQADSKSYFLGGGGIGWMAIGASLFASNISAEHFIGLAGSGAAGGLAVGQFEWLACFILLILGWFFVPFYLRTGVFTMPEFLERRYNRGCRNYLSAISLVAYVFTKVSVAVYAGALVLRTILGWNMYVGAVVLLAATGVYTVFGGLRAVIYTDFMQSVILIGGGVVLTALALAQPEVGGLAGLADQLPASFFSVWKGMKDADFPWTGIVFGAPILGMWYWCTDQMIVQRTLAANGVKGARSATIFAGFLKILPVFILVLPGLAGAVLFREVAPNEMYATMIDRLLPAGVKGLVVAALLAALMSSLSSVFNSSSTLVVMDFYRRFRPEAPEKELVRAGQAATVGVVVIGVLWLPFIGMMSNQLYVYLQSVQAYISPPIAVVFLLGLLWRRLNGPGALTALIAGFVLGAVRFVAEIGLKVGWGWVKDSRVMSFYANINFLHFAVLLFLVSAGVFVGVSLLTRPPPAEKMNVFAVEAKEIAVSGAGDRFNAGLSILLGAIIVALWLVFSPLVFR